MSKRRPLLGSVDILTLNSATDRQEAVAKVEETMLFARNVDADTVNEERLRAIQGEDMK